jgi:hypothetical protein
MALGNNGINGGVLVIDHGNLILLDFDYALRLASDQDDVADFDLVGRNHEEELLGIAEYEIAAVCQSTGLHIVALIAGAGLNCDSSAHRQLAHARSDLAKHTVHKVSVHKIFSPFPLLKNINPA